jgi:hypothetical protein
MLHKTLLFSLLILSILAMFDHSALAENRIALVIGNSAYQSFSSLVNPVNDAADMTKTLQGFGFDVETLLNANQRSIDEAIARFSTKLNHKEAIGLFYYAGHGIQVDGRNYLIPLGANIRNAADVRYEAVDAGRVLSHMEFAKNNLNLMILDACRDNPLPGSSRAATRGLAKMSAPEGAMILYAASPGQKAIDGEDGSRNGLFTAKLLEVMNQPGLDVYDIFRKTAQAVNTVSKSEQTPYIEGVILGDFTFNITNPEAINQPATSFNQAEILFWDSIKHETTPAFFQQYLEKYPQGIYVDLAKLKIKTLLPAENSQQASLTIKTSPATAQVRVLNLASKYQPGMALKQGRYHIEVTHPDYQRHLEWIELDNKATIHAIVLEQQQAPAIKQDKTTAAKSTRLVEQIDHYRVHGDGTISDTTTGLMWKQCVEGLTGERCEQGKPDGYRLKTAQQHAKTVRFADYSDWRVPNKNELKTLVYCSNGTKTPLPDYDKCGDDGSYKRPTIRTNVFPNAPASDVWSSSPGAYPFNGAGGWVVNVNNGQATYGSDLRRQVRLVRSEEQSGSAFHAPQTTLDR